MSKLGVVVLAAGQGTRMKSALPKVLHPIAGRPMIQYVLDSVAGLVDRQPVLVVGHGFELVQGCLGSKVDYARQEALLGTGHAVLQARSRLEGQVDQVLVLYGDMPLLSSETVQKLIHAHGSVQSPLTMLTCMRDEAMGFGRIVRDARGDIAAIVEEAQATPEQMSIKELNPGVYCFEAGWLWQHLPTIPLSPKGEYYLTDLVGMAVQEGHRVGGVLVHDTRETLGVNDRLQLAAVEAIVRQRIRDGLMRDGVTLQDPGSIYVDATVTIGQDAVIGPNTHLQGATRIGCRTHIGPNSIVRDSTIGDDCRIEMSVVEGATMENSVSLGPFGHLRKGAYLEEGVHMGNFGEVKNSRLGPRVRMGHFSYIGDTNVEADVNIGAGTVTCNYDGTNKFPTHIGEASFVGSGTMLVAPVNVGARVRIGAGSVVTRDIPPDSVAYGVPARIRRVCSREDSSGDKGEEKPDARPGVDSTGD